MTAPSSSPAQALFMTMLLITAAMLAFAANSVLCRLALAEGDADAGSFTIVRIASGALMLALIVMMRSGRTGWREGNWSSAAALAVYALGFSIAYLQLDAGMGALILFAAVQATMIGWGLMRGERLVWRAWLGMGVAIIGLIWLVRPGTTAPAPVGTLLMTLAGIGWGVYSLRGRRASKPIAATAGNFLRAALLVVGPSAVFVAGMPTATGWWAAVASGALTSGIGYVIWYAALPHLRATSASVVQLTVPAIAAIGGVLVLGEVLTPRLVLASVGILGGVLLVLLSRPRATSTGSVIPRVQ